MDLSTSEYVFENDYLDFNVKIPCNFICRKCNNKYTSYKVDVKIYSVCNHKTSRKNISSEFCKKCNNNLQERKCCKCHCNICDKYNKSFYYNICTNETICNKCYKNDKCNINLLIHLNE